MNGTGMLGLRVVEVRHDGVVQALEAVDLAPGRAPAAEVLLQPVGGFASACQARLRAGLARPCSRR